MTLSSSSLAKVLQPSIVLFLTLDDGSVHTFQVCSVVYPTVRFILRSVASPEISNSRAMTISVSRYASLQEW